MTWPLILAVAATFLFVGFIIRAIRAAAARVPAGSGGTGSPPDSGSSSNTPSLWWPSASPSGDSPASPEPASCSVSDSGSSSDTSSCDSGSSSSSSD